MDQYVVRDVVRDVIGDVAVNELFIVDGLGLYDDDTVIRRLKRGGKRNEPLGFGVEEVTALATPVLWLALDEMAKRLAGRAADGAVTGVKGVLRKVFHKETGKKTLPELSEEELAEVERLLVELAATRGLDSELAQTIATVTMARLRKDPVPGDPDTTEKPSTAGNSAQPDSTAVGDSAQSVPATADDSPKSSPTTADNSTESGRTTTA
ncbi:hypothetical protein KO481_27335 [Nocardia sp. NEAU-G5]|uniref:Uncharacterized protein n=1 Tax=Nocardia albiluteola TaxID=2842303 RepID=A0ABS6B523_9NOCA|nr:hypothetical protein [Nocardia albiluteola]MBU3065228.1 hypothetical protein [Nocardia albiluteola]